MLPGEYISFDLIQGLEPAEDGYTAVLLIIDVASRMITLRPLKSKTAEEVGFQLLKYFCDFGIPSKMRSDKGREFRNGVVAALAKWESIDQMFSMPYAPETNGLPERGVKIVKNLLKKVLEGELNNWVKLLPIVQRMVNLRVSKIHMSRPLEVYFGRSMRMVGDELGNAEKIVNLWDILERNRILTQVIWPQLQKKAQQQGDSWLEKVNEKGFTKRGIKSELVAGDQVMKLRDVKNKKMEETWEGPYTVVERDEKTKGYKIMNRLGQLWSSLVPGSRLSRINATVPVSNNEWWEIESIRSHRGTELDRSYLLKFKNYPGLFWTKSSMFNASAVIHKYWLDYRK